ncbi:MAG: DUF92 domain-containing protein [Salinibacter sp.]|uniref:DUF92 domain-containing protein n=1 Tax=Salinibacter sp. TaxID=2065818 RepID=UPI0035D3EDCB
MFDLSFSTMGGLGLLAALAGLGGLVGIGEGLRTAGVPVRTTRRLVHGGVGLFVAATPWMFATPLPVYILAGLFCVLNAAARARKWWAGIHEARPESWGTVAMPLAVVPALAATWSVGGDRAFIFQTAFLVLAVADPLAGSIGESYGRQTLVSGATWIGSSTFFGTAALLVGSVLVGTEPWSPERTVPAAVAVAFVATAVEAVCGRGEDNLFVVLAVVLILTPLHETSITTAPLVWGLIVGVGVCGAARWSRVLDARGAVGAGLFAASLVGLGGWAWAMPGFAFFLLSSALSWLPGGEETEDEETTDRAPTRTLRQVVANGGVAWGLLGTWVVLPPGSSGAQIICYAGFLGALASAAADTWATELGGRLSHRPRSLRTLQPVPPGTSGAVSLAGTGAAALGAASVAGAAWGVGSPPAGTTELWVGAASAGLIGMAVDSIAGATIQAQYRNPETGRLVEQPVPGTSPTRGWRGVDNEVVNLLGTTAGAAAAIALTVGI